ncbi:hypothetical protein JCM1841_000203 [Sporobolomyces salmonicolor]
MNRPPLNEHAQEGCALPFAPPQISSTAVPSPDSRSIKRDGDASNEQRSKRARIHSDNTAAAEASEAGLTNQDHPVGATSPASPSPPNILALPNVAFLISSYLSDDDESSFRASSHAVSVAIKASSDGLETLINSDPSFGGLPSQRRLLNLAECAARLELDEEKYKEAYDEINKFAFEFGVEIIGFLRFPLALLFRVAQIWYYATTPSSFEWCKAKSKLFLLLPLPTRVRLALEPYRLTPLSQVRLILLSWSNLISGLDTFGELVIEPLELSDDANGGLIYHLPDYGGFSTSWGKLESYSGRAPRASLRQVVVLPPYFASDYPLSRFHECLEIEQPGTFGNCGERYAEFQQDEKAIYPKVYVGPPIAPSAQNLAYPLLSRHERNTGDNQSDLIENFTLRSQALLSPSGMQSHIGTVKLYPRTVEDKMKGCRSEYYFFSLPTAFAYPSESAMTVLQVPIFLPPDVDAPANFLAFLDPAKLEIRLFISLADGQPGIEVETNSLGQARARYWTSILFNGRDGLDPAIMAANVLENLILAETKVTLEAVVKGPAPNKNDIARQKAHEGLSLPVGFRPAPNQLAKSKPIVSKKLSDNGLDPLAAYNVVMQVDPPYEVIVGEGNISLGNVDTLARPSSRQDLHEP